jgi:signal transduction histidine kinase
MLPTQTTAGRIIEPNARDNPARLRGHTLLVARVLWIVIATVAAWIALTAIHAKYDQINTLTWSGLGEGWSPAALRASLAQFGLSMQWYARIRVVLDIFFVMSFFAVAVLIVWRKSEEWMALFVSLFLVTFAANWVTDSALMPAIWYWPLQFLDSLAWMSFLFFFVLFPDGRFVPRWTRLLIIGLPLFALLEFFLHPWLPGIEFLLWLSILGGAATAQVYRYCSVSGEAQRQQIKWVALGFTAIFAMIPLLLLLEAFFPALNEPGRLGLLYALGGLALGTILFLPIPISIAIALLRYRLWDIDIVINRTIVYSALTGIIVGLYVLTVASLSALFQVRGNFAISIFASGLIAVLFHPLRDRLQHAVNHLLYGERDDPYLVLSRLGQRLEAIVESSALLPTIAQTVREALKLPYTAIALAPGDGQQATGDQETMDHYPVVASSGVPVNDTITLPLIYKGESVGQLILGPRVPGEVFGNADRRLLEGLARQAGIAVHTLRLTVELQRSRERLVIAREEERRRLRRDLHDGLGPALAAQTLKVGSARAFLQYNGAAADDLLAEVERDIEITMEDLRSLINNLRPPVLDELGLVGAIRQCAAQYHSQLAGVKGAERVAQLHISVEVPDYLPDLPAAVEMAAYRIVQEALTNVVRHANAQNCRIRLSLSDWLQVEVQDDGTGLALERHMGVGLASMRERAEELGGTCVIEPAPAGGTRMCACLPLPRSEFPT